MKNMFDIVDMIPELTSQYFLLSRNIYLFVMKLLLG